MAQDRFMIAPLNTGLVTDLRPWLIPDEAFARLKNAYIYKGRARKRFGSRSMARNKAANVAQLTSRLRLEIGTGNGTIDMDTTASGDLSGAPFAVGQLFSAGDTIWTVTTIGGATDATLTTVVGQTCTLDTTASPQTVTIAGIGAGTDVFFYPALPVMGLPTYEKVEVNEEQIIAFDTRYAYEYAGNAWQRLGTAAWTGDNADFFWGTNYRGANSFDYLLFVSNYVAADGIRYLNGSTWTTINPVVNGANTISTARIIIPFKDRLLLLNTIESTGTFRNRLRYSQNGDPTVVATSFLETTPGLGGFLDAPTKEAIVTAEFIKDRLIVYFERSTWELAYTGNQILPFRWQKINTELGAEGTFSVVPFDKAVLGVGNVGIHACNGANVERIDDKIEEEIFAIANENDGPQRVHGIRDYEVEQVYWTFPSIRQEDASSVPSFPFPDRVLVYNYENGAWALNDDSITAFGYYQDDEAETWRSTNLTWAEWSSAWNEGTLQARFRNIIAGNQQGFMFIIGVEVNRNAPALQITAVNTTTNAITVIDHNLKANEFILLESINGVTLDTSTNTERESLGITDVTTGNFTSSAISNPAVGQKVLIGTTVFTIADISAGANAMVVTAGSSATGTFNGTTNIITITGNTENPSTTVYFFSDTKKIYKISSVTSTTITPANAELTGTYTGGGTIARVSQIDILTKQYNFYLEKGSSLSVSRVDFQVDKISTDEVSDPRPIKSITVDYSASSSSLSLVDAGIASSAILGTAQLETSPYKTVPLEQTQTRLWHPVYMQLEGEFIQLRLKPSDSEMIDFNNATSDFQLHAMIFHAQPTSSRLQ